jgi:hypothetical protein
MPASGLASTAQKAAGDGLYAANSTGVRYSLAPLGEGLVVADTHDGGPAVHHTQHVQLCQHMQDVQLYSHIWSGLWSLKQVQGSRGVIHTATLVSAHAQAVHVQGESMLSCRAGLRFQVAPWCQSRAWVAAETACKGLAHDISCVLSHCLPRLPQGVSSWGDSDGHSPAVVATIV